MEPQTWPRDLDYEEKNVGYDWQYPKGGIKCKNLELCGVVLPKDWWLYKARYLCTACHDQFGTWSGTNIMTGEKIIKTGKGVLEFKDNIECPICLEENVRGVNQPNCEHIICLKCFKRCYYGDEMKESCPKFPYPELINEYYDDQENPKWKTDYSLIEKYNKDLDEWDDKKLRKFQNEENLRNCSLCRK